MQEKVQPHQWHFQRLGGSNQVLLKTGEDIKSLSMLDPKLWMILSCPTVGLEFDQNMLKFLDQNGDDRIRISEVLSAIEWLKPRLKDFSSLIDHPDRIDLENISSETPEGQKIISTAKAILANLDITDINSITLKDIQESTTINAKHLYNGDGIFPASNELSEQMQNFIDVIISVAGAVHDASGENGINLEIAKGFVDYVQKYTQWNNSFNALKTKFSESTASILSLIQDLKPKIDDYFLRADLACYAPQAQELLNVDQKYIVPKDNGILDDVLLSELPLSKIEANAPLNLQSGINPIWQERIVQFAHLSKAYLSDASLLTHKEWLEIQTKLDPYQKIMSEKPTFSLNIEVAPTTSIDKLTSDQIDLMLSPTLLTEFETMVAQDLNIPISTANLMEIEKFATYHAHLYRFLNNFVSFNDFFSLKETAIFQSGELYLDGRCCLFCSEVTDIAKHSILATYSSLYLIYCNCVRKKPTGDPSLDTKIIVAAMTAGDCLFLVEGRNGIYLDNLNNDWDATIVKIIKNPISIKQAILDPYRRIGNLISTQINKWVTNKDSNIVDNATKKITSAGTATTDSSANKFDIAKSAGIFAAIGLALGALGTAVASITASLFSLTWWQVPLVFAGIFIIISGPSVILAWLKLRNRALAPFLEASGWATNGNTKINFYLGSQLTSMAKLPPHSTLNLADPTKKRRSKCWIITLIFLFIAAGFSYWHWRDNIIDFVKIQNTDIQKIEVNDVNIDQKNN